MPTSRTDRTQQEGLSNLASPVTVSPSNVSPVNVASPVAPHERLHNIDILRGFALLGILLVNLFSFSAPYGQGNVIILSAWQHWWDQSLELGIRLFAEGAFYSIFSILFGVGFAIQLERSTTRVSNFTLRFSRRLLVLFLIGLAHLFFIWHGDILTTYAIVGFALLAFRKRKTRTLLIWIACLTLIPIAFYSFVFLSASEPPLTFGISQRHINYYISLYRGSWATIQESRIVNGLESLKYSFLALPSMILWLFLVGVVAYKQALFSKVMSYKKHLQRMLAITLPLGLLCKGFYAHLLINGIDNGMSLVLSHLTGGPLLGISYGIMLLLLLENPTWYKLCLPIANVGRMALSNYLAQSLVCTLLFYGYGLGLYGKVEPVFSIPLMLALYALQVFLSSWWLKRFNYGPMEWLWRRLSYGKLSIEKSTSH